MNWYYESNGLQQGPVSESELRQLITLGRISRRNLLWRNGMHDWTPLGEIADFFPQPQAAGSAALDHPLDTPPAAGTEDDLQKEKLPSSEQGERDFGDFDGALRHAEKPESIPLFSPSWEADTLGGGIKSFILTTYEVLFRPSSTFSKLNHLGSWGSPLSFYLISNVLSIFLAIRTTLEIASKDPALSPKMAEAFKQMPIPSAPDILVSSLISSCLLCPVVLLVVTGVLHFSLMICGAANRPIATTLRVVAYATGAGSTLWLLPTLAVWATQASGDWTATRLAYTLSLLVAILWLVRVLIVGLARAQTIGTFRATTAVFLPLAFALAAPLMGLIAAIVSMFAK